MLSHILLFRCDRHRFNVEKINNIVSALNIYVMNYIGLLLCNVNRCSVEKEEIRNNFQTTTNFN